jgi:hypothetical protein
MVRDRDPLSFEYHAYLCNQLGFDCYDLPEDDDPNPNSLANCAHSLGAWAELPDFRRETITNQLEAGVRAQQRRQEARYKAKQGIHNAGWGTF